MRRSHRSAPSFFHCMLTLVMTWTIVAAPSLHAQKSGPTENEVKSGYLYNFGKLVEWPAKATRVGEVFPICVLCDDTFVQTLKTTIARECISGNKILVIC